MSGINAGLLGGSGVMRGPADVPFPLVVPDPTFRAALESTGINSYRRLRWAHEIDLDSANLGDVPWSGIEYATNATRIYLNDAGVTGDIASLAHMTKLEFLYALHNAGITGDVGALAGNPNLERLYFNNTGVSGNITNLFGMTQITDLRFNATGVSGDLVGISALTDLNTVYLTGTNVTPNLSVFAGMTELTTLYLNATGVTGDLSHLASATKLVRLRLSGTSGVTVTTTPALSTQPNLSTIDLDNMGFDNAAVDTILAECVASLALPDRVTATLALQDNAAPSAAGVEDVNTLVASGWTVTHD